MSHIIVSAIVLKLRRSSLHTAVLIATVAAAITSTLISLRKLHRDGQPSANRPIQSQVTDYVTSNSCQACHPDNYASWHASFHRTMTQLARPDSLPAEMAGLELSWEGRDYKAERRGKDFFVCVRPKGGSYGEPQQVVLVTGSHTLQILWLESGQGRTLQQFPFAYIIAEKIWAPVNQTFLIPPDLKEYYSVGAWNGACMDCHITGGRSVLLKVTNGILRSRNLGSRAKHVTVWGAGIFS